MEENNLKSAVEAIIFASEKPVTLEQIKKALDNPDYGELRKIIDGLKSEYQAQNRGFRITEIAGGFQMNACTAFAPFLRKLFKNRSADKLSKPVISVAHLDYRLWMAGRASKAPPHITLCTDY